jgi:hypothetical protein
MREICTSGSVGGEGGNILAYLAGWRKTPGGVPGFSPRLREGPAGSIRSGAAPPAYAGAGYAVLRAPIGCGCQHQESR